MSELVDKALRAKRESKYVDFERSFDPDSAGEWCELIKDIVAIANTGGGVLLVGVENDGNPSGENVQAVLDLDHATVSNAVFKEQFSNIKHYPVSDEAHLSGTSAAGCRLSVRRLI